MLSIAFLIVRIAANGVSFAMYDHDYTRQLEGVRYVSARGTVVALARVPCRVGLGNWFNSRLYHLPWLAVVRKEAFVNATWSISGLHSLRVKYPAAAPFLSDPSEVVFSEPRLETYARDLDVALGAIPYHSFDRLWLLDIPRNRWPKSRKLRRLWASGDSVIYDINHSEHR